MTDLKVVSYSEKNAGKTLKFTKKLYVWEFFLDAKPVNVQFLRSKVTSKKKVIVNSEVRFKGKYSGSTFQCQFHIGEHTLIVIQQGKLYDLRIDSLSFAHLWLREKTQREFVYEEGKEIATESGLIPDAEPVQKSLKSTRKEEEKTDKVLAFKINPVKTEASKDASLRPVEGPKKVGNRLLQIFAPKQKDESRPNLISADPPVPSEVNILDLPEPQAAAPVFMVPQTSLLDDFWTADPPRTESPLKKLLI